MCHEIVQGGMAFDGTEYISAQVILAQIILVIVNWIVHNGVELHSLRNFSEVDYSTSTDYDTDRKCSLIRIAISSFSYKVMYLAFLHHHITKKKTNRQELNPVSFCDQLVHGNPS